MSRKTIEDDILSNLNKFFGYKSLRPGQLAIVTQILQKNDVLICKEKGYGKSLCFQLAGLIQDGVTIIISPLLSSAEEECDKLAAFTRIKCAYLHTDNHQDQEQDLRNVLIKKNKVLEDLRNPRSSELKFLYVTIDYILNSSKLKHILIDLYKENLLNAVVVDEVHCVTQWIYSFKSDYSTFGFLRDLFFNVPFLFCSGPITKQTLALIQTILHLRNPYIFNDPSVRYNLSYKVMYKGNNFPTEKLIDYVKNAYTGKTGFMYCQNKESCLALSKKLRENGVENFYYHSAISDKDKAALHSMVISGIVVVCVSGADVDISLQKVDYVVHTVIPNCLEVYFQEAGKAGKNTEYGDCVMFYSMDDCDLDLRSSVNYYMESMKLANAEKKEQLGCQLKDYRRKINEVVVYAENTSICRQVFLLKYFNDESVEIPCGICDVCIVMKDGFVIDMSHVLRKILMCAWSINRHQKSIAECDLFFTATVPNIIAALLGTVKMRHCDLWLVKEWFYGSFASWDAQVLHRFLYVLISHRYLAVNHVFNENFEAFENLIITPEGQEFVKSNNELTLTFSLKDTSFTKWLNIDWIADQYKKDLDGVVLYHALHSNLQRVAEWHGPYVTHLFHTVPGTWDEFKEIKMNYMKNEKNNFDEDLFTVCLIYYQIFRKLKNGNDGSVEQQQQPQVTYCSDVRVKVSRRL
ncbi:putative ATP-dependent DNA helicase Q1 isoform X1 [Nasonia vitripennis]|uniref:ATP-dependent DNA helicase n=1 Tax=Nasonia vitripennis TaxID=7425 RepID=A0A7M7H2W0_NASVI|nr:putative ATP-dependent DNA helicase Q1 isoform X1 [Nasonia vitripennis]XP_008203874.1 putative ATP-dependent DNA helicase Q1 isoform X1 [Nasonia vitripennis]XP_031781948.1 putative ATP-dependent DNA helicase Q1 isoform X1 [Nasonia vitripennis]